MVTRYDCLQHLAEVLGDALVLMWGGGEGQEWWHLRPYPPSLYTAFGYATPMGFGLARALPHRKVVVLESDGGILFNLGALCTLGNFTLPNLKVIVMDNECYESIGAMPTATAGGADLEAIARGSGIDNAVTTRTLDEFKEAANHALAENGLYFIVAKIEKGTEEVPTLYLDGLERKYQFVRYVEKTEGIHIISPGIQHVGRYWEKK